MHRLLDVHSHIQFPVYDADRTDVIKRAKENGVGTIAVGTQKDTSAQAISLAKENPDLVYASVGLHPIHTERSYHDKQELGEGGDKDGFTSRGEDFNYVLYKKLALSTEVVAIGECGLDYYRLGDETKTRQKDVFLKQIELSREVKKPLMIHCRHAFADLIDILKSQAGSLIPGVIHFFTGSKEDAAKLMDIGFSFSFGGVITFALEYEDMVRFVPIKNILLETDAPYVAPVPYRGKRNEPVYVMQTAKKIAELKSLSYEEVAAQTTSNAVKLFGL